MGFILVLKFVQDLKDVYGGEKTLLEVQREMEDYYYGKKHTHKPTYTNGDKK